MGMNRWLKKTKKKEKSGSIKVELIAKFQKTLVMSNWNKWYISQNDIKKIAKDILKNTYVSIMDGGTLFTSIQGD